MEHSYTQEQAKTLIGAKRKELVHFDDLTEVPFADSSKIKSLRVWYTSEKIVGIQATYYSAQKNVLIEAKPHKGSRLFGVSEFNLTLADEEYLVEIGGKVSDDAITRLHFITSSKRMTTVGGEHGKNVVFSAQPGQQIGTISGGIDTFLG